MPESITTIRDEAFMNTGIVSIKLPDNLTTIDFCAFKNCIHLKSITFGINTTFIGASCFENSFNMSSIILPPNMTTIYGNCFKNAQLNSIEIPFSVTSIGVSAFEYSYLPEKLIIHENINTINVFAFHGVQNVKCIEFLGITNVDLSGFEECKDLIEVTLPKEGRLSFDCFKDCTNLQTVRSTPSLNILENQGNAFENCYNLQDFPFARIDYIYEETFKNCTSLKNIDLRSIHSIDSMAFYNCTNIRCVRIGDGTYIGYSCFQDCINLKYLYIGKDCNIHYYSFYNCEQIKYLIIDSTTEFNHYDEIFSNKISIAVHNAGPDNYADICNRFSEMGSKFHFYGLNREYFNDACNIPMLPAPNDINLAYCRWYPETLLHERDFSKYHFEFLYLLST